MLKISLALLVVAIVSIPALAAPEASEHERALFKAKKWSHMSAQIKGRLPSNVVKEFADYAEDIDFPSTRRFKNKLMITETDGTKVTIEFKKDGAISLNGKDWKLRPLATVEEEVDRLALFISGEKKAEAGFLGLLPAAQAGGAGGLGAAAAAFASANAWKAESCGEEELSKDLVNDCPLMAVKMQPILVKARKIEDPEKLLPVSLKCPSDNSGIFELVSKNAIGQSDRIRVAYEGKKATFVSVAAADKGNVFEDYFKVNINDSTSKEDRENSKQVIQIADPILNQVCLGSRKNKERYLASLKANREDLLVSLNVNDGDDDKNSMEAL